MTRHQNIRDQANQANDAAIQGGIDGGIRWFLAGVIVFGTAQLVWPPYRKLTPQFKVPFHRLPESIGLTVGVPVIFGSVEVFIGVLIYSYCGGGGDKCGEEV